MEGFMYFNYSYVLLGSDMTLYSGGEEKKLAKTRGIKQIFPWVAVCSFPESGK